MYSLKYGQGKVELDVPNIGDVYLIDITFTGNLTGKSNMPGEFIPIINKNRLLIVNGDPKSSQLTDKCILYYNSRCKIKYCTIYEISELGMYNENIKLAKQDPNITVNRASFSKSVTVSEVSATMKRLDSTWSTLSEATSYNYENKVGGKTTTKSDIVVNNAKLKTERKFYTADGIEYNGPIHYHSDLTVMSGGEHNELSETLYATPDKQPVFRKDLAGKRINLKSILNDKINKKAYEKESFNQIKKFINKSKQTKIMRSPSNYMKQEKSGGSSGGY